MAKNTLEAWLEQLLEPAEPPAAAPIDRAVATARLAAALDGGMVAPSAGEAGDPAPALAAHIDGSGAKDGRGIAARLADDSAALHEVAAGIAFIDRIAAAPSTAPPELVAAAVARLTPRAAVPVETRRRWSPRAWQWSSAVAALMLLVAGGIAILGERAPSRLDGAERLRANDGLAPPRPAADEGQKDELVRRARIADCPVAADSVSGESAGKAARDRGPDTHGCGTTIDKARIAPLPAK